MKRLLLLIILILLSAETVAYCHPGGKDNYYGHKDTENVSGLGEYHYHCYGSPAHLHTDGSCPYKKEKVIIKEKIPVTGIILNYGNFKTNTTYYIEDCFEIIPINSIYRVTSWESSDSTVLKIKGDKAIGLKNGKAVLTVYTDSGYKAEFPVTVGTGIDEKPYKIAAAIAMAITAAIFTYMIILRKIRS